jgi:hypothetical protein
MKFRMKSVPVDAYKFTAIGKPWPRGVREVTRVTPDGDFTCYVIVTPDGPATVRDGDWIIINAEGIASVLSDVQFLKQYEPIQ